MSLYYVMPYLEGETLRDRLVRERQLPVDEAVRISREVADALAYAHGLGIVHRDIKPENILFMGGHAVIADFGVASAVDLAGGTRLTQSGLSVGTPVYMSPEQALGQREVDGRSDIYSLGCVLYEMLAGEPPFEAPNPQAVLARKLSEAAPGLSSVRDSVSPGLESAVRRALAKLPADRFDTAAEFAQAISRRRLRQAAPRGPRLARRRACRARAGRAGRRGHRRYAVVPAGARWSRSDPARDGAEDSRRAPVRESRSPGERVLRGGHDGRDHQPAGLGERARRGAAPRRRAVFPRPT